MNSKQKFVSNTTTEVKRSERLFRKRSFRNKSIIKDDSGDFNQSNTENKKRKIKIADPNETKPEKPVIRSNSTKVSIVKDDSDDSKKSNTAYKKRKVTVSHSNKTKPAILKNSAKKLNNRIPVPETSVKFAPNYINVGKASNFELSLIAIVENEDKNAVTKNSSKTTKNKISHKSNNLSKNMSAAHLNVNKDDKLVPNELEENDGDLAFIRKRGRPSLKRAKLPKPDDVVNPCNDKVNQQKTKNLLEIVEKLQNTNKSTSSKDLGGNTADIINNPQKMTTNENHLTDVACSAEAISRPRVAADEERIASTETVLNVDLSPDNYDADDQQSQLLNDLGELEREINLLSKTLMIPSNVVTNMVVNNSIPIIREKYSDSITPSMLTVSPIVTNDLEDNLTHGKNPSSHCNVDDKYIIDPIRECVVYEKTNMNDLMSELSKTMPSWSLSIVNDPSPRYVISQMSIGINGVPIANKSIVLDRYFRASVYVNQCLEFKYCKHYTSVAEIIKLIKALNLLS